MLFRNLPKAPDVVLKKTVNGKNATERGAFYCGEEITFTASVPRAHGFLGVVLRIARDGEAARDLPFGFLDTEGSVDRYRLTLSLAALCAPAGSGLFYYEVLFLRGADTMFTDTADNVNFTLSPHTSGRFRLLVSENDYDTPRWFRGRTMYHIFVDRFAPRGGKRRAGDVYHENWHEELLQFGACPGAPVANNEFFGGTLWGIIDKLDYLKSLGVGVLYLSPIFRAASNHKYDTGDYEAVDEQFGGKKALRALLDACRRRDIGVVLDGVFNHTGDDSRYFNRRGNYDSVGAYQSVNSPYFDWYYFKKHPDSYLCWWDIPILPKMNLSSPVTHRYFVGEGGIVEKYTKMGVLGWRLDVVDELPNDFLDELRLRVKKHTNGEGIVLGEVWENAADKIAYGKRRRYFEGRQLDSVMNYPLRRGIISFVRDGDAAALCSVLTELWGSYPEAVCHCLMNILSTHDTERILTTLGGEADDGRYSNSDLRDLRLSGEEYIVAKARLMMAAAIQYTVFGVPSLFYGDEAGLEGYHDPFCRRPYPWGKEDGELLVFYRRLGKIRQENPVFASGDFGWLMRDAHALAFERRDKTGHIVVAANRGGGDFTLNLPRGAWQDLLTEKRFCGKITIPKNCFYIWRKC